MGSMPPLLSILLMIAAGWAAGQLAAVANLCAAGRVL
jgi:hypothetical protein